LPGTNEHFEKFRKISFSKCFSTNVEINIVDQKPFGQISLGQTSSGQTSIAQVL